MLQRAGADAGEGAKLRRYNRRFRLLEELHEHGLACLSAHSGGGGIP